LNFRSHDCLRSLISLPLRLKAHLICITIYDNLCYTVTSSKFVLKVDKLGLRDYTKILNFNRQLRDMTTFCRKYKFRTSGLYK
jgi:hypothetical protein